VPIAQLYNLCHRNREKKRIIGFTGTDLNGHGSFGSENHRNSSDYVELSMCDDGHDDGSVCLIVFIIVIIIVIVVVIIIVIIVLSYNRWMDVENGGSSSTRFSERVLGVAAGRASSANHS